MKCKAPVAKINMTQRQCYCTQHCEFMWSLSALLLMRLQLPFCFIYSSLILQHHTFLSLYYSLVTLVFSWVVLGRLDSGGWHTGSVGGEGRSGEIKRRLHVIACFCVIFCCVYSHAKSNISPVLWKKCKPTFTVCIAIKRLSSSQVIPIKCTKSFFSKCEHKF